MYEYGLHEGEVLACQELLDGGEVEDGPAVGTAGTQEHVMLSDRWQSRDAAETPLECLQHFTP
jgi:hypothetical protein